jgi:DNA glycosylase AlkZ-like
MHTRLAQQRLENQRITRPGPRNPEGVVAWMGAIQAQEYPAAKWTVALRMPNGATDARVERAFNEGRILRTHVMRPTWHFVAAADIDWMLTLTAPNVQRRMSSVYRQFELDTRTRVRATRLMERALAGGDHLTRAELAAHLARSGLTVKGVPLALLTVYAELERVLCSGAQRGKQSTYALLPSRVAQAVTLSRDEALAELARRYFRSHGPATIRDFVWWSGLTTREARRGVAASGAIAEALDGRTYWTLGRPRAREARPPSVHLLPTYDEYFVAYRDLDAVPRVKGLQQTIVAGGHAAGTWKAVRRERDIMLDVATLRPLTDAEGRALAATAARYGRFLGVAVTLGAR